MIPSDVVCAEHKLKIWQRGRKRLLCQSVIGSERLAVLIGSLQLISMYITYGASTIRDVYIYNITCGMLPAL